MRLQPAFAGIVLAALAAGCAELQKSQDAAPKPAAPQITESQLCTRANEQLQQGVTQYQAGDYAAAVDLHKRATALAPADYLPWGNLGNALLAEPATADRARTAFQQAATLAQGYIATRPAAGTALAALGWFLAHLGRAPSVQHLNVVALL